MDVDAETRNRMRENSKSQSAITTSMFITQKQGDLSERYKGVKVLGKGSFGEVILCKDKTTGMPVAVKVISKKSLKKTADADSLLQEVELLKQLDHPNIMKLFEFFEDKSHYFLVGEAYTGGELFDVIVERKRFSERDAAGVMKQVMSGINYMHTNKVVHRDLKPENLLLESKQPDALIKIIDFGLSAFKTEAKMQDRIGTAYYIAPEVLRGTYDEKCDIWSAGVILYILLSGSPPFFGNTEQSILERVQSGRYSFSAAVWKNVSKDAKDLIKNMLFFVPSMRWSAQQVLDSDWIRTNAVTDKSDLPALEATLSNIRKFRGQQKLGQAAMLYMASKLTTAEETKELTAIFQQLDTNGDGRLDADELRLGYQELLKLRGLNPDSLDDPVIREEVADILSSVDFDNNGYLDYSEFITIAIDRESLLSQHRLQKAFALFDTDGSGRITVDELMEIFSFSDMGKILDRLSLRT